jgi:sucrose phosphorylase
MDQERNLKGKNIEKIRDCLIYLYGVTMGKDTFAEIQKLLGNYRGSLSRQSNKNKINLSQRDAILITYGDQLIEPSLSPLNTLGNFCHSYLDGLVSGVHILPFFPSTSDDGFSVTDFRKVNPNLGSWKDIATIGKHFRLMFDAVINHVSSQSAWFQAFLREDPQFRNYFIVVNDDVDLSQIVRPRA